MWLIDHQMNNKAAAELGMPFLRLPLKASATIVNGNALTTNWDTVVSKHELSYILGNPPFKGFKYATLEQQEDMQLVFGDICKTALLDYVSAWYKKAAEYIQDTKIEVAFVSTNSIVQGTQVGQLWGILFNTYHVYINFAHRTFKWSNEAKGKAAVHCVIIGFSLTNRPKKLLVEYKDSSDEGIPYLVDKINPYLVNTENIVVTRRRKPLCDIPEIIMGNQVMDGGNLIIEDSEYENFIAQEPLARKYVKQYMMGQEFINNKKRYCLWLKGCPPNELRQMPLVLARVENVRKLRAASHDEGARRLSETPTLFRESRNPSVYVAIPITSTEQRKYIPIAYLNGDVIPGNTLFIVANASLYHFGILTSNVHMAWVRTVVRG